MSNEMISGIEKALLAMKRIYQAGYDRIIECGGSCDTPDYMMAGDPTAIELRALLAKPVEQHQGEPVAYQFQDRDGKWCGFMNERHYQNTLSDGSWPIRALYTRPAEQPAQDSALKAFANEMINAAFEGGSFEGGDIQDIAVKHGLMRIERREEEECACRSEGYGFPAECYRRTALLNPGAKPCKT